MFNAGKNMPWSVSVCRLGPRLVQMTTNGTPNNWNVNFCFVSKKWNWLSYVLT